MTPSDYFPSRLHWETVEPEKVGLSTPGLAEAVAFAQANETDWPRSLYLADGRYVGTAQVNDQPPYDRPLGPVRPRGASAGIILRGGRIAAQWGDTTYPDTTFSAAKSYLGLLAGLALDDGLIASLDEPVATISNQFAADNGFASNHNRQITWRQLLQQTSEWQGTLWGIPDSVDHHRQAGPEHDNRNKGKIRDLQAPGSRWEYNDVRVNRLALSLMQALRRPLPDVLRERVMNPIGASNTWEWHGYENSIFTIDEQPMVSVSGGGHWGGGLFISTLDHARVGLLVQRYGRWENHQLISTHYMQQLEQPCAVNPIYGFLWWLNTDQQLYPSAPADSIFAIGGGQHLIWIDRQHDLTVVVRWIERAQCNAFIGRVLASIE